MRALARRIIARSSAAKRRKCRAFTSPGEYDLSGTIVGVVEKSRLLDGRGIKPGDAVIGLASSGLHTNGYSLARKIFFEQMKLKPRSFVPELRNTIGDELLKVHVSYGPLLRKLLQKRAVVKGLAHITGGGFVDNIPRVLPKKCDVVIHKGSWDVPPIFQLIADQGRRAGNRALPGFQHGHRHDGDRSRRTRRTRRFDLFARNSKQAWLIGGVTPGIGKVRMV